MTKEEELTQYCSELLCPDYSNCDLCMYNKGRADAIYECYAKAKTMMDELSYQSQGRRNGKMHRLYCLQALDFLRQVTEQLKEQINDD